MNRNLIKKDGFSNLDTQRFYESWTEEWQERNSEQDKHCGFCLHCHFLLEDVPARNVLAMFDEVQSYGRALQ